MRKCFTVVVAVALLGFTACSGGSGSGREKGKVSGEGDTELTLNVPTSVTVTAGKSSDVDVMITRKGFDDDVTIKFEDLAKGTSIDGGPTQKIEKGATEKKFILKAEDKADEVKDHTMKVSGTFNDKSGKAHTVSKDVKVNVKKK